MIQAVPGEAWGPPRVTIGRIAAIIWALAAVAAVVFPLVVPPASHEPAASAGVRTFLVVTLAVAVLFGPGLAIRFYSARASSLGWAILPGGALLAATGLVAWALAGRVAPATTCRIVLGPETLILLGLAITSLWRRGRLEIGETMAVAVVLFLLLVGAGRDLYSLGPVGETNGGTVSRAYEATIIPDSRISFHTVQLVANGAPPYGHLAKSLFRPYNFSARGPLPGLAAAPLVLTAGAEVPTTLPDQPWAPFDQQGFAAYRLTMETFAAFALLSLFSLVRTFSTARTAAFALVLAATTPFVVHEVYFTWPKLASAGLDLLAAEQVLRRRPLRSGLLVGFSYLLHPVGLVALPGIALLSLLWIWRNETSHRVRAILWSWAALLVGVLVILAAWQLVNLGHQAAGTFVSYPLQTNGRYVWNFGAWLDWRLQTLSDTVIPFHQLVANTAQPYMWPPGVPSPPIELLGIGYWGTLALGAGILFYPLLLFGIGRSLLRHPFVTAGCVLIPFLLFVVYWGSLDLGLMLAGLQAWLLGTIAVYAWTRSEVRRWPVGLERCILVLRVPEVAFMILAPTVWTQRTLVSTTFGATDIVGLVAMVLGLGGLLWCLWRVTEPALRTGEPAVSGTGA